MRPARLARAPIPWREMAVGLVILAMVAGFGWVWWAYNPAPGPRPHLSARVLKLTYVSPYKWRDPTGVLEIQFEDGRRDSVSMPYGQVYRCKPGDTVTVTRVPKNAHTPGLTLDPGGCAS